MDRYTGVGIPKTMWVSSYPAGFHFSEEPQHHRAPSRFHKELCEGPRKGSKGTDGVRGTVRSQRPAHPCRVLTAVLPGAAAEESPVLPTSARCCPSVPSAAHQCLLEL